MVHPAISACRDPQAGPLVANLPQLADMAQHVEVLVRAHPVNAVETHRVADGNKAKGISRGVGKSRIRTLVAAETCGESRSASETQATVTPALLEMSLRVMRRFMPPSS
jgi:hypothetical protein